MNHFQTVCYRGNDCLSNTDSIRLQLNPPLLQGCPGPRRHPKRENSIMEIQGLTHIETEGIKTQIGKNKS